MVRKKTIFNISSVLILLIFLLGNNVVAEGCDLDATLVNQDPHPAIPGDYVEVLFQINGIEDGNCEDGTAINLILDYPFSLDDEEYEKIIKSSTYAGYGFTDHWNVVYNLRIDKVALEGDYEVELRYKDGWSGSWINYRLEKFNISIRGGNTDFEVHIQNYNIEEKKVVFEVLNIGNQDIEALVLEIPKQENINVIGSNRNVLGDLDSNEYTTAEFEAILFEGDISLKLYYTDPTDERRIIEKMINYDSSYFINSSENLKENGVGTYVIIGILVLCVIVLILLIKKKKNKKKKNNRKKFEI